MAVPLHVRVPGAILLLLMTLGCSSAEYTGRRVNLNPLDLWLRTTSEPQPPTRLEIATWSFALNENGSQIDPTKIANLSGAEMLQAAHGEIRARCIVFMDRIDFARVSSRYTASAISAANALTLSIMGITSAAAPAVAIVGASLAAVVVLHNAFDQSYLHSDSKVELQSAMLRNLDTLAAQQLQDSEVTQKGVAGLGAAQSRAAKFAAACNYQGLRDLLVNPPSELENQIKSIKVRAILFSIARDLQIPAITQEQALNLLVSIQKSSADVSSLGPIGTAFLSRPVDRQRTISALLGELKLLST